jgi:hypothetical protein
MTKALLATTAIIEAATGVALLAVPTLVVAILLGAALETSAGLAVARLAGAALLSIGVACGFGSRDPQSYAAIGIVTAALLYNLAVVLLLLLLRYDAGMTGIGLLPASVLHAALAVWCIACLRATWWQAGGR